MGGLGLPPRYGDSAGLGLRVLKPKLFLVILKDGGSLNFRVCCNHLKANEEQPGSIEGG